MYLKKSIFTLYIIRSVNQIYTFITQKKKIQNSSHKLACLFVLRCNVPVNSFSVMSGQSHHFLGINQYLRE